MRLMILCTTTGYQTHAFVEAAHDAGLEAVFGSDRCHVLEDPWQDGALPLHFEDAEGSALQIAEYASRTPLDAIVALGDRPAPVAARACHFLGLLSHPPHTADVCRDKSRSRGVLRAAGLHVPMFNRYSLESDPSELISNGRFQIGFPCVLKPLALSASRGVIRADNPAEFVEGFHRIRNLLRSPDVQVMREATSGSIQVEEYIDGSEIAVEGVVIRGELKILAIFAKPDPLEGPFFEETIYVTPAPLSGQEYGEVRNAVARAANAVRMFHGPFHAELRINRRGIWPIEIAARSIGGLCSRALRFRSTEWGENISLERVIIALALGEDISAVSREEPASGVMMIPVEQEGIFEGVAGVEEARATPGIEDTIITAKPGQHLIPWPEGCSYPGFIFARGDEPGEVEKALRCAHGKLRFRISPALPVVRR